MSASRPKLAKPKPKPRPFTVEKPEIAVASASGSSPAVKPARPAEAAKGKKIAATAVRGATTSSSSKAGASALSAKDKGKGRAAPTPRRPLGTASEPEVLSDDESEDDFEEVPIPTTPGTRQQSANASAGPSSPYPYSQAGTPGTTFTARTTPAPTTAGETDEDPYAEDDSGEEGEDGVIRLEIGGETAEEKAKRIALAMRKKPMTSKDRIMRIGIHKLHVLTLLASIRIRNKWANNMLLKARLLSLLPHPLVTAFSIPPSRFPDRAQRARLFVDALQSLVLWWTQTFFDVSDTTIGHRTRPWDEVQEIVDKLPRLTREDFLPGGPLLGADKTDKEKQKEQEERLERYAEGAGGERLRTVNSLMKKALQQEGSRDVSAILFVALCRACGLGTRLVVSLQAVPWRAEKVVQKKPSGAGKGGRSVASRQGQGTGDEDDDGDESMEEVPIPGDEDEGEGGPGEVMEKIKKKSIRAAGRRRQQDPAEVYRLRKPKPAPQTTGAAKPKVKTKQDLANQPPVFWAEVFSRPDQKWFPVDVSRGTVRKKGHFEPSSDNGPVRMTYVIAFEEDGYARDVTLRYTKSFGAKTAKLRAPQRKDEPDWWEGVLGFLTRPYRLNRDDLEDAELENSQISEAMPVHMNGFKDHPLFVLERHLKREEVIQPKREVGKFRGEPVYRRAHVLSCKTAENWMRIGRKVKDRQEPLKWVKQRAMTINKRREVELAKQAGEEVMQGLYSESQTAVYTPPPIKDGKIPQNAFGNIDLYAPTMLPQGASHLPYKGIAKVAKQLGVSYAEACTGFEFKKQRAIPVITGIVVPEEQASTVMDAYWASTAAAEEREKQKRVDKALKRWGKLINALRVRQRLRATYGDKEGLHDQSHNPLAEGEEGKDKPKAKGKKSAATVLAQANQEASTAWVDRMREGSESPQPAPEVIAQDFAHGAEEGRVKLEEEDDDDDMEEVDVAAKPSRDGSLADDSDEDNDDVMPISRSSARAVNPLPVGSVTKERSTRKAVDNPYEDSDSDEEKGLVSADDQSGYVAKRGEESEDSMDEVDFTPKEPTPPTAPQTTRSGRTIKLRVGMVKEAVEETVVERRTTRSSKRKR